MKVLRLAAFLCVFLVLCSHHVDAQTTLTNESVVKMVRGGLGDDVVIGMIEKQPGKFNVSPDDLLSLKQQGVSDHVLAAMIAHSGDPAKVPTVAAPAGAAPAPMAPPDDGKLPYLIAHWHVKLGCHTCDFGPMYVTPEGIDFRGSQHQYKWRKDQIDYILAEVVDGSGIQMRIKGDSQNYLFVICRYDSCNKDNNMKGLRDMIVSRLGGLGTPQKK